MFKKKNTETNYIEEIEAEEKNLLEKEDNDDLWESPKTSFQNAAPSDLKVTVINEDSVIEGNVHCQGKLTVLGVVHGDVSCEYELVVEGEIQGNVKAADVEINRAVITGDIEATHECAVSSGSKIVGNIKTEEGTVDGEVKGIIEAKSLHVQKNAVLCGDLKIETLSVLQGARIDGRIVMSAKESETTESSD